VEERTKPDAEVAVIDQRIWDLFGEDLAILFTDLVGFSRHVAKFGIVHFLQIIFEQEKLLLPVIERHDGVLLKSHADSLLILFRKPIKALECAIAMQKICQAVSERRAPEEKIVLCCGVGWGKVLKIGDDDVFGHEVNLASKLGEDTAKGNEILVTNSARAAIGDPDGMTWESTAVEVVDENTAWRALY
jgi:class 3 adenylate cyclase